MGEAKPVSVGAGSLSLSSKGKPRFKLYDSSLATTTALDLFFSNYVAPGTLLSETNLFELTATDVRGRQWRSSGFRPLWGGDERGATCTADLWQMEAIGERGNRGHDYLWLYFPGEFEIPSNRVTRTQISVGEKTVTARGERNVWEFNDNHRRYQFTRWPSGLQVYVESPDGPIGGDLHMHVEETIWFVLARPVSWTALMEGSDQAERIAIRSPIGRARRTFVEPPLRPDCQEDAAIEEIFRRYLEYAEQDERTGYHPTSVIIRRLLEASSGSLEVGILLLGIAVESLINREYRVLRRERPEVIRQVETAKKILAQNWKTTTEPGQSTEGLARTASAPGPTAIPAGDGEKLGDESPQLLPRVLGAINHVAERSVRSALNRLAELGIISESQIQTWRETRHALAHGAELPLSVKDLYRSALALNQLVHLLILQRIGYSGPITDRSETPWREAEFKPVDLSSLALMR